MFNYIPWDGTYMATLIYNMLPEDIAELSLGTPEESIKASINNSVSVYAVTFNDILIGILGIGHLDDQMSVPWFLRTTDFKSIPLKAFIKESRQMMTNLKFFAVANRRKLLGNTVLKENTRTIKWLQTLGFEPWNEVTKNNGKQYIWMVLNV